MEHDPLLMKEAFSVLTAGEEEEAGSQVGGKEAGGGGALSLRAAWVAGEKGGRGDRQKGWKRQEGERKEL